MLRYLAKAALFGAQCAAGRPRAARNRAGNCLTIFTYHSFRAPGAARFPGSIPAARFERQLNFLRANFEVVSLDQGLRRLAEPERAGLPLAAITIDDGFANNYHVAWPLLRRHQIPATVFVATDFIDHGRVPWPDRFALMLAATHRTDIEQPLSARIDTHAHRQQAIRQLKQTWQDLAPIQREAALAAFAEHLGVSSWQDRPALSWDQLREMQAGGVEIGSHTVFHSILRGMTADVVERELLDSRARIEEQLQAPCRYFAYPNGDHDARVEALVSTCGYAAAVTQDFGSNVAETPRMALRRVEVPHDNPLPQFSVRASRALANLTPTGR